MEDEGRHFEEELYLNIVSDRPVKVWQIVVYLDTTTTLSIMDKNYNSFCIAESFRWSSLGVLATGISSLLCSHWHWSIKLLPAVTSCRSKYSEAQVFNKNQVASRKGNYIHVHHHRNKYSII